MQNDDPRTFRPAEARWRSRTRTALVILCSVLPPSAFADPPTPDSAVGDIVTNPETGIDATVDVVIVDSQGNNAYVLTSNGDLILVRYQVGDLIYCVEDEDTGQCENTDVFRVVATETNADTGFVDKVSLQLVVPDPDPDNPEPINVETLVQNGSDELDDAAAENAGEDGEAEFVAPQTTAGTINEVSTGRDGNDGGNAYGVRICFPFVGCVVIGKSGSNGQSGAVGPTIDRSVTAAHGDITSVVSGVDGIRLGSIGGDGGDGGNSYGNIGPYRGGDGGSGGTISLETSVKITTTEDDSHGIAVFSRSGSGGDGGDGLFVDGGSGGSARTGGPVTVANTGEINTLGDVSHGIYALSVGGAAGSGGDGWGIVGEGGSGAVGGDGGPVTIFNDGVVRTHGANSHAIFGQSIGGTGGNGGDAGGIVGLGGGASQGGIGGDVSITNGANARVFTAGDYSIAIFGQSIGGSGGDSGGSGGIVALGSSGGTGSDAGDVTIRNAAGSVISTTGSASHAVFGQSVGGGGGNAGASGGAVALGGTGSSGGDGGSVEITNAGAIETGGVDARGIFAQSVGGGGGAGGNTGGLFSLGGSGGAGSDGDDVTVTNEAAGSVTTRGLGADAIFAQSVGGGGGSGASSGGLRSLGGSGSTGGSGGAVTVTNWGTIATRAGLARGIFAQSIGGGGGSGGDSGGLSSIGGAGASASDAGDVIVTNFGSIRTEGPRATGIFAQSVGGGGGDGGSSDSVIAIGGAGGGGGHAGTVTVQQGGAITTVGDDAFGILAEAVGGGGGNGGSAFSAGGIAGTAIGGRAGAGGNGETVTVTLDGASSLVTGGERSIGIMAQSVGGGGGNGGAAIQGSGSSFASISSVVGGDGNVGGRGGTVILNGSGSVTTSGGNSTGVMLQSVGGGGGNGGLTVAGATQVGIGGAAIAVTVGAQGGAGGAGGEVRSNFNGSVTTAGDVSTAFIAQSVGGGGGNGGATIGAAASAGLFASGALSTAIGGAGDVGGIGGLVDISIGRAGLAQVWTSGLQSSGIVVQSVGGGGGNGGLTVAAGASGGGGASGAISTAIGGSGAKGGDGGQVDAAISANVLTEGDASTGVIVQSVGGGGGNGGVSVGGSASGAGGGSLAVSTSIGGSGDEGGDGGVVNAAIGDAAPASIETRGDQSTGVLVQSVGGGGGNGGVTVAASVSISGGASGAITTGVGGSGDGGGDGGHVESTVVADVLTDGDGSSGVIVQSIGGGGGNGGLTNGASVSGAGGGSLAVSTAIGGAGGIGGDGGIVEADFRGGIETRQDNSTGLLAQSIGGGGGNGGGSIAASFSVAGGASGAISTAIGGAGSAGGDGGLEDVDLAVTLDSGGSIVTRGHNSSGILAQSIGGGGGNGGYSIAAAGAAALAGSGAVSVGIGGSGSLGGDGKGVDARSSSDIWTFGNDSSGFVVQSIGGGGGNGGYSVSGSLSLSGVGGGAVAGSVGGSGDGGGNAGAVLAASSGTIHTAGERSIGLLAQSVGGGGGSGGFNITGSASGAGIGSGAISGGVGGSAGAGGDGDTVDASSTADIVTRGRGSIGVLAQSIGGGGGNGGYNISGALSVAGTGSGVASVGVGGSGGAGGDGALVTLNVDNDVSTLGENATGVVAQSIGGGGGNGGFNITAGFSGAGVGSGAAGVGVGGAGEVGGLGGDVDATVKGVISTAGDNSMGVLAQSVGGGGGNGGMSITAAVSIAGVGGGAGGLGIGGFGAGGGESGAVNAATSGAVVTVGNDSTGVVAQSIGGGGGNGGMTISGNLSGAGAGSGAGSAGLGGFAGIGGKSGTVDNAVEALVMTSGDRSAGVMAQSVGGGGGNGGISITATVSVAGVGSGAAGIGMGGFGGDGGDSAAVTNAVQGTVVTGGDESIGVIAQSIGGGGGNGGLSVVGTLSGAGTGSGAASVGIGGAGGGGGHGAAVTNTVDATVQTTGDRSAGVLAQSVGGGGGSGGVSITGTASVAGAGSGAAGVGIGGFGGDGGNAAVVRNSVEGSVSTAGDAATAVVAQSIGGGGGNGGLSVAGVISGAGTGSGAVAVAIGGTGGGGGQSAEVFNDVAATVTTEGDSSIGVLAQSVGGGGGNGGIAVSGVISIAGTGSGAGSVGLGGSGGGGGDAAAVENVVAGSVTTRGEGATGIVAQSVGGGGGSGGLTVAGTLSAAGNGGGAGSLAIGGFGGDGGDAADVTSRVDADIVTTGMFAAGLLSQSVGGGGGSGGISVGAAVSLTGGGSGAGSLGIGGSGGGGGTAGAAHSVFDGTVLTSGSSAAGIVTQSIGGGGGNGGLAVAGSFSAARTGSGAASIGVGGAGGDGGQAATVSSTVAGFVRTAGDDSVGVLAQSVGGGGGNGGTSVAGTASGAGKGSGAVAIAVGGVGGGGGAGASVSNTVTGGVITTGDRSNAVLTQSVGGGGGNGGVSVAGAVSLSKESSGSLALGVGGFGGAGGDAGDVNSTIATTDEFSQIGTTGQGSTAIVAQSIGGGGGSGGVNVSASVSMAGKDGATVALGMGGFGGGGGNAGDVTLGVTGAVVTEGNDSHGLIAQSVGGGGGNGGVNVSGALNLSREGTGGSASIGVGGFGGSGGNAGNVALTYQGDLLARPVDAEGDGSHGILAQSLGGGGGNGGVNVSAGLSFATGEKGDGHALVVGVGGFGGGGGNAGSVDVAVLDGSRVTSVGDDRSAIFAQSIGGGGGNGAVNVSAGIASDAPIVFGMGGFGGSAGTAGAVNVDAVADISARGDGARGIFAQSVGGGGGNGGLNVSGAISFGKETLPPSVTFGLGGFGGAGNISDDVTVMQDGSVLTSGEQAHGIFAQSLAGGGGNGGINISTALILADDDDSGGFKDLSIVAGIGGHGGTGADAGSATVTSAGDITTHGAHARGIFAQSIGGGGGNGGINFSGNVAKKSSIVTMGVGGFGSGGGNAGSATVNRGSEDGAAGRITTEGTGAIGIEASSIGGGGGDAGVNIVASVLLNENDAPGETDPGDSDGGDDEPKKRPHPKHTGVDEEVFTNYDKVLDELEGRNKPDKEDAKKPESSEDSAFAVQLAIGGAGGGAGDGGEAVVNNFGDIETLEQFSHGILAQSIGGGGGNASYNVALAYIKDDSKNRGLNLALGGATGDGGRGAGVTVVHDGSIETHGADSHGIIAQSVGGGGGNAGANLEFSKAEVGKIGISIGRRGGEGGEGGDVSLNSSGAVVTHGDRSWGLIAQSIGNGGGNSTATTVSLDVPEDEDKKQPARGGSVSVGLEGGVGGGAGNVEVTAAGLVATEGEMAHAIFAQSVGGGGGNGGDANAKAANASISIGGTGGTGGTGGEVDVTSSAEVRTAGEASIGIIAQSVGGGGGTGGKSGASIEGSEVGLAISLGGSGGTGAASGRVTVDNLGVVATAGAQSYGILAQSLGGGGGNANMSVTSLKGKETKSDDSGSEQPAEAEPKLAPQIGVAVGGTGGTGAVAGAVIVRNTGTISTQSKDAVGIFAQSIGGGGGNASQTINQFSGPGAMINFGVGGAGGVGGTGGDVTVENLLDEGGNAGRIVTMGEAAHGIVAMSIGGGGGTGGTTISQSGNEDSDLGDFTEMPKTFAFSFNVGGAGGEGGTSGLVTVTNDAEIVTVGKGAHGLFAQSIGGGGGNGGLSYSESAGLDTFNTDLERNISIGGVGGSGNVSGDVVVTNDGSIEVFGDGSFGIFAQSVGGGGGNGGIAGAAEPADTSGPLGIDPAHIPDPTVRNFAVGGAGGDGANSGDVLVDHTGSIVSHGADSYGIYAQSVSGGGGTLGASYISPAGAAFEFIAPLIIGSRDGGTGEAGRVTVNTAGSILMLGDNSHSHHVQSVNGGGGNLQFKFDVSQARIEQGIVDPRSPEPGDLLTTLVNLAIEIGSVAAEEGAGAAIQSEHVGDLIALGRNSSGSSTQSVGGGGGSGLMELTVNDETEVDLDLLLGGTDSANSGGGDIDLARTGDVATAGASSTGTSVQSIGGGGGTVNLAVTTVPVDAIPSATAAPSAGAFPSAAAASVSSATARRAAADLIMGSSGSLGNDGGDVHLTFSGDAQTEGALSPAVQVQSIGAGGGDVRITGLEGVDVSIGARDGASGDGGDIALTNSGDVFTFGDLSHGVVLQSIGGGGGVVLTDLDATAISVSVNPGNTGSGGDIAFEQRGAIATLGNRSIALLAQSLGGGGGIVDRVFMGSAGGAGRSGSVTLSLDGHLLASGSGGVGVVAQSIGRDGQGDVNVTVEEGGSIVGAVDGAAVWLMGGASNRLTNHGWIMTTEGSVGMGVLSEDGNDTIDNFAVLAGSVDLGRGDNRIDNRAGAVFAPGSRVDLGSAQNLVASDGILAPGATGRAQSVDLNGSYLQSGSASAETEIDFASDSIDQLVASGTVDLAGTLRVSLLNTAKIPVGDFSRILFQGRSGLVDHGMVMETVPSVVIDYDLEYVDGTTATLAYAIDFRPDGMGDNLDAVGEYINRGQVAGGGDAAYGEVITKLVYDPDLTAYRDSLSQLSPEFFGEHQVQFIGGSVDFGQRLMSCKQAGGEHRFTREGSCVWLQYDWLSMDRDAHGDYKAVSGDADRLSVGAQRTLESDWSFGFGYATEDNSFDGFDDRWTARGSADYLGLSVKRRFGPTKLSGVLSYSWNETDSVRRGTLTEPFVATSTRDMDAWTTTFRYSYDFEFENWYLRPMVDAGWMRLNMDSAREQGADAINLVFADYDEDHLWVRPAVEFGKEFALAQDYALRLNLDVGAQQYLSDDSTDVRAWLEGGRTDVAPISVPTSLGNPSYGARIGVEIFSSQGFLAQIYYAGSWYDDGDTSTTMLRFQVPVR